MTNKKTLQEYLDTHPACLGFNGTCDDYSEAKYKVLDNVQEAKIKNKDIVRRVKAANKVN